MIRSARFSLWSQSNKSEQIVAPPLQMLLLTFYCSAHLLPSVSLSRLLDTFKQFTFYSKTIYQNKKLVNIFPRLIFVLSMLNFLFLHFISFHFLPNIEFCAQTHAHLICRQYRVQFLSFGHIFNVQFQKYFRLRPGTHSHTRTLFLNTEKLSHCKRSCCGNEWSGKMINISKRVKKQINQVNDLTRYGSWLICVFLSEMTRKHTHKRTRTCQTFKQTIGVSCLSAFLLIGMF